MKSFARMKTFARMKISTRTVESENIKADHDNLSYFIQQFFKNADIGERVGSLFEATVSSTLLRSGFKPWPLHDLAGGNLSVNIGGQRRKQFQIPDDKIIDNPNIRKQGEIDCVVCGDNEAWSRLLQLCPYSHPRYSSMGSNAVQLFLVEAKVSKSEFIERIKMKGVETYTVDNNYWLLLEPLTIFEHKVLFVNGGEDSKAWVMHGGDSSKKSERDAWHALKERNISLFYCESFSQEWVTGVSGKLINLTTQNGELQVKVKGQGDKIVEQGDKIVEQGDKIVEQGVKIDEQGQEIHKLKETVQILLQRIQGWDCQNDTSLWPHDILKL